MSVGGNSKTNAKAARSIAVRTLIYSFGALLICGAPLYFTSLGTALYVAPLLFYIAFRQAKIEVTRELNREKYECVTRLALAVLKTNVRASSQERDTALQDWKETVYSCAKDGVDVAAYNRVSVWDFDELVKQVHSDILRF